jgi:AmmeMemoRadiSam system protein B
MSQTLPRLRMNLDFMPSPVADRPGLLIRDPYRYSEVTLIIPPALIECLRCFNGQASDLDLRQSLVRITGDLKVSDIEKQLVDTLSGSGFLEDDVFHRMKDLRHREFASDRAREAVHAGTAYPHELEPLRGTMLRYMNGAVATQNNMIGIADPHVSPEGGWQSYQAAYGALGPQYKKRTFVVLGTSHYGEPERFGLTRKPFVTPFGEAIVDVALVDWLEQKGDSAIHMEDYCHSIEHSIEFQVLFLQHVYGPHIRILPILCGSYSRSILHGGLPEDDEKVRKVFDLLGELAHREGERLFWILGIDMAHMGRRYGDSFSASANRDEMASVAQRDSVRIDRVLQSDAEGFWSLVQENRDDLKWCGSAPIYTFLRAVPGARGNLHRYQQWNIDDHSVVSFASLSFAKEA